MPFRKVLVWIRNQYLDKPKDLFLYSGAAFLAMAAICFLADFLLPWDQWAILVRALIAIPAAIAAFVLGYGATLAYVDYRSARSVEYQTWRARLSPLMRQRISMLIGALLFVLMFAVAQKPGYTLASSIIVALVAGLFAFMRKTSTEINRELIGLPDTRDAAFDSHIRTQAKNATQKRLRKASKEEKNKEKEDDKKEQLALEKDLEK